MKNITTPQTYSTAKKSSEKFLKNNYQIMEEIAVDLLEKEKDASGYYKERYYCYNQGENYVKFEVDSQGMLGGQYWSLIFTEDGCFLGETEVYLYKEALDGNNIVKAEKIDEQWWFYWIDYDGTDKSEK